MMFDDFQFSSILVATIRNAPVLMFASMAGLFAERSGVIDLALEGKMLAAAFVSAAVAYTPQNPWLGVLAGVGISVAIALLQGFVSITQKGNQLVAAIANIPFLGWFYTQLLGGHSVLVYVAFALIPLVHWVLYHSRFGLRLRAVGENPHAADAAGVNVERTRFIAMLCAGVLCSLSGAYLSI